MKDGPCPQALPVCLSLEFFIVVGSSLHWQKHVIDVVTVIGSLAYDSYFS